MSVSDFLRNAFAGNGNANAQPQGPSNGVTQPNMTVPNADTPQSDGKTAAIPAVETGDKSPLDGFQDLWKADPTKDGGVVNPLPSFEIDPVKLKAAADTIDFTQGISDDVLARAAKGDVQALKEAINVSGRNGFQAAMGVSTRTTQNAVTSLSDSFSQKTLPEILRRDSAQKAVSEALPIFENPALKPMLDNLRTQVMNKNPSASVEQVTAMTKQVFEGMMSTYAQQSGKVLVDKPVEGGVGVRDVQGNENWEGYFN